MNGVKYKWAPGRWAWTRVAIGLALVFVSAAGVQAEETCVECHRQLRDPRLREPPTQLPDSIHGKKGLTCSNCHGGRPTEPSVRAHDKAAGFHARADALGNPAVCGNCHADAQHMATVDKNEPTNQLQKYLASSHGLANARGQMRAATCAGCHGSHDVRTVTDPKSRVYPGNVAATCGHCHSDTELMTSLKMPSDEEKQWRKSLHGRKYARWIEAAAGQPLARNERHPPTCNDCHKDHAIAGREAAIAGCQGCHKQEWESFSSGPHQRAFKRLGFLPCVDCHGSHEVAPVTSGLIGVDRQAACQRCHAKGQKMFDTIRKVAQQVRDAEAAVDAAQEALAGAPIAELGRKLQPIDEARHAMRIAVHTLNPDKIAAAAQTLRDRAVAVTGGKRAALTRLLGEHATTTIPAVALLVLGLLALVAALRKRGGKS